MKTSIATLVILSMFTLQVSASTEVQSSQEKVKLVPKNGRTEFLAVGNPGFLKINGHGKGPQGEITIQSEEQVKTLNGEIEIDLKSLDTGMELRNTHMKDKYLEVGTYPKAKLTIKDQKIPSAWNPSSPELKKQKLKAQLRIHGQTKDVDVEYQISKTKQLDATFEMKISDFKIDIPSFMGVTVADKVTVKVNSKLIN